MKKYKTLDKEHNVVEITQPGHRFTKKDILLGLGLAFSWLTITATIITTSIIVILHAV